MRADLATGWPAGLTVLTGDDLFHLDAAQAELLGQLAPDGDSLALTVFADGESFSPSDVVASARSVAMFAERRVVFVRDIAKLEGDPAALQAYAKAPPERSFLVIRAPKLDLRRTFHQMLSTAGRLLEFRIAAGGDPLAAIDLMARERKLKLEPALAHFLADASAGDLHRVAREIEKLDAWAGGDANTVRAIRLEDARQIVAAGGLMDTWEIGNAILARDGGRAVAAVRRLLDAGEVPYMLLGGLASRVRSMLQARAMLDAGESPDAITNAVRGWMYKHELHAGLRKYTLAEILAFPARLHEADLALKSRGLDHRAVLETLVMDLTEATAR